MKYFEFKYIQTKDGEIVNQGDALYYTSAEQNIDEMKQLSRDILKDQTAVISIPLFTEIDRETSVEISDTNVNEYKIYNKTDNVVYLTNSLAEFLCVFINKGIYDGLYEWRQRRQQA